MWLLIGVKGTNWTIKTGDEAMKEVEQFKNLDSV